MNFIFLPETRVSVNLTYIKQFGKKVQNIRKDSMCKSDSKISSKSSSVVTAPPSSDNPSIEFGASDYPSDFCIGRDSISCTNLPLRQIFHTNQ